MTCKPVFQVHFLLRVLQFDILLNGVTGHKHTLQVWTKMSVELLLVWMWCNIKIQMKFNSISVKTPKIVLHVLDCMSVLYLIVKKYCKFNSTPSITNTMTCSLDVELTRALFRGEKRILCNYIHVHALLLYCLSFRLRYRRAILCFRLGLPILSCVYRLIPRKYVWLMA